MVVMKGVLGIVSAGAMDWRAVSPGAGEEEATSSSSSRARFLRPRLLGPLFAADMLGRRGELGGSVSGGLRRRRFKSECVPHFAVCSRYEMLNS